MEAVLVNAKLDLLIRRMINGKAYQIIPSMNLVKLVHKVKFNLNNTLTYRLVLEKAFIQMLFLVKEIFPYTHLIKKIQFLLIASMHHMTFIQAMT